MSNQTVIPPDLDDVLAELKNSIFANMNCIQIGRIEKVNDNQTVEIKIQVKRRVQGDKIKDYSLLVDCPYLVISGGGAYLDMPIKKGDYCIILFNDRNIDTWWDTANVKEPLTKRKHNLSDGMALVGINPKTSFFESDGTIVRLLGTSGPGNEQFAARLGDEIKSTIVEDSAFWGWATKYNAFNTAWSTANNAAISALTPLASGGDPVAAILVPYFTAVQAGLTSLGTIPSELIGKITGSSSEVKIG